MILDTALRGLETAGRPVRVGMIGAGATGRAIALQLGTPVPGVRLVAIANRTAKHGERAFREAGVEQWSRADSAHEAEAAIDRLTAAMGDDFVLGEIMLLRMRALLSRACQDPVAYRGFVERYRTMAKSLGFEGHLAMVDAMA